MANKDSALTDVTRDNGLLKRRASAGIVTLVARRAIVQLINVGGTALLLRILSVEEFGIYAIVLFIVTLGGYFADAGLGAALVQRQEEITQQDLDIVFSVQLVLVSLATLVVCLAAPWIQRQYKMPSYAAPLLSIMSISLLISSFKTVPATILERRLEYQKLSISDVVELMVFQIVAVSLALAGLGVWSFAIALVLQAIAGSVVLYLVCPWRPRLTPKLGQAWQLLRFGSLFQARTLLSVLKDTITPTLVAFIGGSLAVGYIGFAQKLSSYPLMIEEATSRVAFPAYSRIQHDQQRLQSNIEKTLKLVNLIHLPLSGLLLVLAEPTTRLVFGVKWLPALPAFYLLTIANLTAGTSSTLVTSLYALGRPGAVLKLSTFWAIATWVLAIPLVWWFGWIGLPIAIALLSITVILPVLEVHKVLKVAVIQPILKPAFAALIMTAAVASLRPILCATILGLLSTACLGLLLYGGLLLITDRRWLSTELLSSLPAGLEARLLATRWGARLFSEPHQGL